MLLGILMRASTKMFQTPILKTDKLVIGYSLSALQYAKINNAMLLVNGTLKPHALDRMEDLRSWNALSFELGFACLTPIPSKIETIKIEEKIASVFTEFYKKIQISFNELYIFDLECVSGLPLREEVTEYLVYDWFDIKRGAKQASCKILSPQKFINELVFYPSSRRDGNSGDIKDCYTKSYILAAKINLFENSQTAARLGALSMIKKNGLKGPPRSINEKVRYLNVVLQHADRDIYKHKKKYILSEDIPEHVYCCNVHV